MSDKNKTVEEANKERAEYRAKQIIKGDLKNLQTETLEELTIETEQELITRELDEKGDWVHITELTNEIEEHSKTWGKVSGLSTGYPSLDARIGGLKPGELILIGGETNNGKSAIAQNIAVNVAKNTTVGFITLEMLKTEAGSRLRYMNGGTVEDLDLMFQAEYQIDYRHLDPLFEKAMEYGCKLVVLDYLQYLGRGMTLDEVAKMSKLMKSLALKHEIPFIVIVSLRKSDGGKFKRKWTEIETEDLMGTSAIAYDADAILVASRKNLENEFDSKKMYLKIVKARNMPIDYDNRFLEFEWDNTRVTEPWVPPVEIVDKPVERKDLN